MRETKFRVMYFADEYGPSHWKIIEVPTDLQGEHWMAKDKYDWSTWSEWVGLTDKHGKPIFEGDILLIGLSEEQRFYPNVVVRWKFYRWVFGTSIDWDFQEHYFEQGNVEVIGNIWETPQLVVQENNS